MGPPTESQYSFPEPPEGLLTAPENRVIAHMDTPDAVATALDDLAEAGFDRDQSFVLCGAKGAERLDVSGRDHGLKGRIYRIVEWIGDEREMVLMPMQEHLAAGGLVVSVPADDGSKATAAEILGDHGGHSMHHFGKGHWEPVGP